MGVKSPIHIIGNTDSMAYYFFMKVWGNTVNFPESLKSMGWGLLFRTKLKTNDFFLVPFLIEVLVATSYADNFFNSI